MRSRRGFTLVEMLVVITILLVLAAMTVTAVNFTLDGERTRAASRQVQSYLEGARSRAIYARNPVGVRFLLDQIANQSGQQATVSGMVYIGPPPDVSTRNGDGFVALERLNKDNDQNAEDSKIEYVHLLNNNGATDWLTLYSKGLIVDGVTRIQILRDKDDETGRWFTVRTTYPDGTPTLHPSLDRQILRLSQPFPNVEPSLKTPDDQVIGYSAGKYNWFRLELPMTALPNEEPVLLPEGIVIDLNHSSLPFHWKSGTTYSGKMDIVFSPRGTVIGPPAAKGLIHFLITDRADTDVGVPPAAPPGTPAGVPPDATTWDPSVAYTAGTWVKPSNPNGFYYLAMEDMGGGVAEPANWPTQPGAEIDVGSTPFLAYPRSDKLIVSLFTQTGNISSHHVYEAPPGAAMDWFRYAETGQVAGN